MLEMLQFTERLWAEAKVQQAFGTSLHW